MNNTFLQSLIIMLWGMLGIFMVLLIIYFSIKVLMKLFPADDK